MAQRNILACDRHKHTIPAIGTFELSNGRPKSKNPKIDLCQSCYNEILALFTPPRKGGRHVALEVHHAALPLRLGPAKYETLPGETNEQRRKRLDRERHAASRKPERPNERPSQQSQSYWPYHENEVMAVVKKLRSDIHIKDVAAATHFPTSTTGHVLRRLVDQKLITTTGGKGRWRRYHLATEPVSKLVE